MRLPCHRPWAAALAALVPLLAPAARAADEPTVRITGSGADLERVPLAVPLPAGSPLAPGNYLLAPVDGGPALPANVIDDAGTRTLGLVLDRIGAAQERVFRAAPAQQAQSGGFAVSLADDGPCRVTLSGQLVTELHPGPAKPYWYPVIGPTGQPYTRSYPMAQVEGEADDHPHQRSFWLTHGNVNGVDFWASDPLNGANPRFGTIRQERVLTAAGGHAFAIVHTANRWVDGQGKTVCEDERVSRFFDATDLGRPGSFRVIDCDATLRATAGPVTFGDTKEGTFGVRVASSMDVKRGAGGRIVNAEGVTDAAAWGKRSPWVDYTGPVGGQTVGIAILNHPESFRHPTAWHVRDYGLFAANPFGYEDFGIPEPGAHTIPAGGALGLRHRVVLHAGDTAAADIPARFAGYARPPRVAVEGGR